MHSKWVKPLAASILSAFVVTLAGVQPVAGASLEEIKKRGYMVAVTEDDLPPFEFVVDGKPMGFDHEMLAMLRKSAPFEIKQEIVPWQGLLAGVATGKYDVAITAANITDERAKSLDFTRPIAEGTHYYVKRKGDDRIKGVKDLAGKTVGVQQGSSIVQLLPELEEMLKKTGGKLGKVVQYSSHPESFQDLVNGRVDYVISALIVITNLIKEKPDTFELGQPVSGRIYMGWAVRKGNKDLLNFLNTFLGDARARGETGRLEVKWFGRAHTLPAKPMLPGDRPIE